MIKNTLMRQAILFFVAITVTRYVLIIWLKNPGAVQDDFWSRLLNPCIVGYSIICNFVIYILPGERVRLS